MTFAPSSRLLLGPGPSPVHPRVLSALALPTLGHLDPEFIAVMDDLQSLLRTVFGTQNRVTFAVSGTGSAGMEAALVNVLERGDRVVIGVNGVFGARMVDMAQRMGCDVVAVEAPYGNALDVDAVAAALSAAPTKALCFVHAETSTGVRQDIAPLSQLARAAGALCIVDCVTSLAGIAVDVDAHGIDVAYSGTQKCLSCPPGLAPITFSDRALEVVRNRKTKVASWYLDVTMLLNYWGGDRVYHHTAPINMLYALREALAVTVEEGLSTRVARHARAHRALVAGLEAMGLAMLVEPALRLPQLNTIAIPSGVDDVAARKALLLEHDIEIGGGLGVWKGRAWRIGLMGHGAQLPNVLRVLGALETVLHGQGAGISLGMAQAAARAAWLG